MKEFDLNDGLCFLALTYAMDETRVLGIRFRTQAYYDYIGKRKFEIWEGLKNKTYKFSEFQK